MYDIYWGLLLSLAVSAGCYVVALRFAQGVPQRVSGLLVVVTLLAMFVYMRDFWNSQNTAELLPLPNLIILGNWLPWAVSIIAGVAWQLIRGYRWKRVFYTGSLLGMGFFSMVHPVLGWPPSCRDEWDGEVCLQTTEDTCSPAAAATLLKAFQIEANESEMTSLCLTRDRGTYWQGLYRGLKIKTRDTNWDVFTFSDVTLAELKNLARQGPVILTVGVPKGVPVDQRYVEDWGWRPGISHSVVLYRFMSNGMVRIGDPSVGLESWTETDLRILWQGKGLRLVDRCLGTGQLAKRTPSNSSLTMSANVSF